MRLKALLIFIFAFIGCSGSPLFADFSKPSNGGEIHAVLVAGSYTFDNYRHQANVAHAYQVLLNHGVPRKNVVVLMYDDVAHDPENPFPGQLFNVPDGPDVYKGLHIDYKGEAVTVDNFLAVLQGNISATKGGSGRVLSSGPNDRVFVYFSDHGDAGVVCFPNEMMTAKELRDTLVWMAEQQKFAQLTFYLEACHSGSMFEDVLPDNINIYAITAANASESAYATFCNHEKYHYTCLGDLFSYHWMLDSESEDLSAETLEEQYEIVKKSVITSHVQHFGNLTIASEPVGFFQGDRKNVTTDFEKIFPERHTTVSISVRYVEEYRLYMTLMEKINSTEEAGLRAQIEKIYQTRIMTNCLAKNLVEFFVSDRTKHKQILETYETVKDLECHHRMVKSFASSCPRLAKTTGGLEVIHVLSNLCTELGDAELIMTALRVTCESADLV